MTGAGGVAVTIVTYDSAPTLGACLDALDRQTRRPCEVVVVDNASHDDSPALARGHRAVTRHIRNLENVGFAAAQNQAIRSTGAAWVLVLNPDVVLAPSFVETIVARAEEGAPPGARIGAVSGKLLRLGSDLAPVDPAIVDSAGIVFTRDFRHLDRGSNEIDRGRWDDEELVFGATGAAALYRRAMIDDVSIEGEFYDEAFFAYREDADLAWRAQLFGWDCLYVPAAVGYHVRRVLPERRRELPAALNRHSVKNRFLMRIKNADAAVWRRCGLRGVLRDAAVVGGCLVSEWTSLPAFVDVMRLLPRARRQRALIQGRRVRSGSEIARWFA